MTAAPVLSIPSPASLPVLANIPGYLAARAAQTLVAPGALVSAVPLLAQAGREIDSLLEAAEGLKAVLSRADTQMFEQVIQTLAGLSREVWAAHAGAIVTLKAFQQLEEAERMLASSAAPTA